MTDRNVQWPNRYQLTKVPGTDDIYDLTPAPGTITAEGTMINKASLLTDETAQAYGFTEEELADVVPNNIFDLLSDSILYSDGRMKLIDGSTVPRVVFEIGSYTGTGTTSVQLTFQGDPKIFIVGSPISGSNTTSTGLLPGAGFWKDSLLWHENSHDTVFQYGSGHVDITFTKTGNTVRWTGVSGSNGANSVNLSGAQYPYIAICVE